MTLNAREILTRLAEGEAPLQIAHAMDLPNGYYDVWFTIDVLRRRLAVPAEATMQEAAQIVLKELGWDDPA
jgi:hypothetical protein